MPIHNNITCAAISWIKEDYYDHPFRFCVEVIAWAISIGCAITMTATVHNPPLMILYPIWVTGCVLYCWCAYSRHSFGMLANYLLLTIIDGTAVIRLYT